MTAFVVAPYADRVEILSDGANYTPNGILLGAACKVVTSEAVPLAIVGSGAVREIAAFADLILTIAETTGSVDDTLQDLASVLAEMSETPTISLRLRMAIGAISETRGPLCCVFSTFDDAASNVGAFELQTMHRCFAQGAPPRGEDLVAYGPLTIDGGLENDAAFLMEAMRRQKMVNPAKPERSPFYSVGAHVDFTVIRKDGYEQRRLLTWPDVVGEPIDPFAGGLPTA